MTKLSTKPGIAARSSARNTILALDPLNIRVAMRLLEDENNHRMIPIEHQSRALPVFVETPWPDYEEDYKEDRYMIFELFWRNISASDFILLQTSAPLLMPRPGQWVPVEGAIPESYLRTQGVYVIGYRVWLDDVGNAEQSPLISINLDKTAPNNGNPAGNLALDEPASLIDTAYLQRHGDRLAGHIANWPDVRLEDVLELFLEPVVGGREPFEPVARVEIDEAIKALPRVPFSIAGDQVRAKGDGVRYLYARLTDRAGNKGPFSQPLTLQLKVVEPPPIKDYPPVEFPDESLYGWLNCASLPWRGVKIFLPAEPDRFEKGDRIVVQWQLYRTLFPSPGDTPLVDVKLPVYTIEHDPTDIKSIKDNEKKSGWVITMERFEEWLLLPLKEAQSQPGDEGPAECSAVVTYQVMKADGRRGEAIEPVSAWISLQKPGGGVCDGS